MARRAAAENGNASNVSDVTWSDALTFLAEHEVVQARLNAKKSAAVRKFESEGIDWSAVAFAHRMKKLEPAEADTRLAATVRALRVVGIEWDGAGQGSFAAVMGAGASMIVPPPDSRLSAARAFGDGYNSGRHGATLDANPFAHAPGSEEFVKWRDGWQDGQEDRRLIRPETATVTKPAGRKRGRPAKSVAADVPASEEHESVGVF